jgi:hypothetical protein
MGPDRFDRRCHAEVPVDRFEDFFQARSIEETAAQSLVACARLLRAIHSRVRRAADRIALTICCSSSVTKPAMRPQLRVHRRSATWAERADRSDSDADTAERLEKNIAARRICAAGRRMCAKCANRVTETHDVSIKEGLCRSDEGPPTQRTAGEAGESQPDCSDPWRDSCTSRGRKPLKRVEEVR